MSISITAVLITSLLFIDETMPLNASSLFNNRVLMAGFASIIVQIHPRTMAIDVIATILCFAKNEINDIPIIAIIKMKLNEFPKRIPMIIPMSIGSKGICAKGYLIKFAHC